MDGGTHSNRCNGCSLYGNHGNHRDVGRGFMSSQQSAQAVLLEKSAEVTFKYLDSNQFIHEFWALTKEKRKTFTHHCVNCSFFVSCDF